MKSNKAMSATLRHLRLGPCALYCKQGHRLTKADQQGLILVEALMAILIFSLGVLGLVGVISVAASTQSDAHFRAEANKLATRIVNEIWVNVDRSNPTTLTTSLAGFAHRSGVEACDPLAAGVASINPLVTNWVAVVGAGGQTGLPNAVGMQQIVVGADNQVSVTVCWKTPSDVATRRHLVTTYIN